jgi:hypothetical protein
MEVFTTQSQNTINKDLILNLMNIKKNMSEIIKDRLYIKDFSSRLMQYLFEVEDLIQEISVDVLLVNIF